MSASDRLQHFVRRRFIRLALAGGLVATGTWAFFPYVNYRIASSAFVHRRDRIADNSAEANRNAFCDIGRLAEVRFQRTPFAFLASIGDVLNRVVGIGRDPKDHSQVAAAQ